MSFKEKAKTFGRVISRIAIFLATPIPCVILLSIIPIISIIGFILESLVKFRQEKFIESNSLKEAFEQFQADSLPAYKALKDNEKGSVSDLISDDKKRIARFNKDSGDTGVQELIKSHQDKDEVTKELLLGCISLRYMSIATIKSFFIRREAWSVVKDVVDVVAIIPKMFLFLFLRALEAKGLSHVKLPKSETYKTEIKEAFSLLSIIPRMFLFLFLRALEATGLSDYRLPRSEEYKKDVIAAFALLLKSTMEKEVAQYLQGYIYDNITSSMLHSSSFHSFHTFIKQCEKITVKPEDHNEYEKINNRIVEKIAGIFRLLTNVKLGIGSIDEKAFKNKFNHEVYNLLKCARFANLDASMEKEEIIPSLESRFVQDLGEDFSNFLDNLLKIKAISGLPKEQKADYINICCTKVLKTFIDYGSVYGSNCPEPRLPLSYNKHLNNIATHLSNDIIKMIKNLSLGELTSAYLDADIFADSTGSFYGKSIMGELYSPMKSIIDIIRSCVTKDKGQFSETDISVPDGIKIREVGGIKPQPRPLLLATSSSQDNAHVNSVASTSVRN